MTTTRIGTIPVTVTIKMRWPWAYFYRPLLHLMVKCGHMPSEALIQRLIDMNMHVTLTETKS